MGTAQIESPMTCAQKKQIKKPILPALAFSCLLVATANVFFKPNDFPKLTGPYLGQKPPGMKPEIFAPGIVSTGMYERDMAVTAV
jgi:hypothetical protein